MTNGRAPGGLRSRPRPADPHRGRRHDLASLIVATVDGLSIQVATDQDAVDLDATFAVLGEMVRDWLREETGRQL